MKTWAAHEEALTPDAQIRSAVLACADALYYLVKEAVFLEFHNLEILS